jgi:hypothetical protein
MDTEMMFVYFFSKKDPIVGIIFFGVMGTGVVSTFVSHSHLAFKIIMLFGLLYVSSFWFGTSYKIDDQEIKIKSGPFTTIVPIKEINRIRKIKTLQSAPALSFDRIAVDWGKNNSVIISPREKEEFIRVLKEKNRRIKIDKNLFPKEVVGE